MIKKIHAFIVFILFSAVGVASSPLLAFKTYAAKDDILNKLQIADVNTDSGAGTLKYVGGKIINILLLIAGILAIAYLVYAGIMYITAGGDTAKADKGRTGVVNAIIGLIIITAAYVIVRFSTGIINNTGENGNVGANGAF